MIAADDILRLPYTPDLTQSGIDYALRALIHARSWGAEPQFPRLRRIVADVALELALRRHLGGKGIPFRVSHLAPYTHPDRHDISLGGHRCSLKTSLVSRRSQISALRRDFGLLLDAPALIASEQFAGETHGGQDIYIFGFLAGLVAAAPDEIARARAAGQPVCLVHVLPPEWAQPPAWHPLDLALKSENDRPIELEIGGHDAGRDHLSERVTLPSLEHTRLASAFHSLAYLRAGSLPRARVAIHSRGRRQTYLVQPVDWGNIWVYGIDIWLAGFISCDEFRRRAAFVESGAQVFPYGATRERCLAVPLAELHPLGELLERVRQSQQMHRRNSTGA
jgi:hypothetical protein